MYRYVYNCTCKCGSFTRNKLPSFLQPHPVHCMFHVPVLTRPWWAPSGQTQLVHGSSDMAWGVAKREQSLPSPFLSLKSPALPCGAAQHHDWQEEKMMLGSPFIIPETATTEHCLEKKFQPVRLQKSHPYQFKQLYMHMCKVWFSEAFFHKKFWGTVRKKYFIIPRGYTCYRTAIQHICRIFCKSFKT